MPAPEDTRASAQADLDIGALYARLQREVARTTRSEGASWAELRDLAERYRVLGARASLRRTPGVRGAIVYPLKRRAAPVAALVRRADRARAAHVQRRRAEADRLAGGTARRAPVRVAYYSPMPPSDRASRTTRRCSCPRSASASTSTSRQRSGTRRRRRRALPRRQRRRRCTAGSSSGCARSRASSCCTTSCCTTSSRRSRSAARTRRRYLAALERDARSRRRGCSGWA